ncbi:two-component system sensor histidine kinase KdpD [Nocardioides ginsengisegetis]|uniref:histidine kinase n=1 Tax=Nocardioides ginsengisegetis TaxID=661491 RepID=A0A7W3IXM6_9ACTN|nr:sensor histidine kinase KdpD [Nocardioides ginsengisegetis]MBA8802486.1 two-component system sensor histidine kinase KdpD [Nocardioides ginsengisegetis]
MGTRGRLRVYLGAAPGVGKTYAMLGEGHRRAQRGTDVVVGYVETHGRRHTAEMVDGLEVVPRLTLHYRGTTFTEMDVDAVLARRPRVALVDELAHTNVPGSRHGKRWQDIEELLAAGIDVITTVNIQHLESVNDVVEKITGVPQRETVPDAVVRAADQIELEDMTAEALQRRLAHGNVYAPEKIDAALSNYFRAGNLNALRELALLWTADRVDDALQQYREQHAITGTWEARERVVVALTGGPEGETLVRRAARIAARSSGGDLLAVHVARSDGLSGASQGALAAQRLLVESLGGTYHQVLGDDVPEALLAFARAENATQLVLGDSRRHTLARLLSPGTATHTVRASGDIDVHIVTHSHTGKGLSLPHGRGSLSTRRRIRGFALAVLLPPLLAVALTPFRGHVNLVSDVLLFLLATVVVSLVGGLAPALIAAVAGSALLNYFFTPPLHTLTISETNNALALLVFVLVAALVSSTVDAAARRTRQAARAAAESRTLANLAGSVLGGPDALTEMLQRVRETFALTSVTLLERGDDGWTPVASAGSAVSRPSEADTEVPAGDRLVLALRGRLLEAEDQRLVGAFAAQAAVVLDHLRLSRAAAEAAPLAEANKVRTALLAAVGHDFRTPLAAAKAAVSTLLSLDIHLSGDDRHELLQAADTSLDRLAALVDNLLDMSRLQVGAMSIDLQPTAVDEVVARALDDLGPDGRRIVIDTGDDVPLVQADPGLLERVLANLGANALRYSPAATPPHLTCSRLGDRVEVRVIDRGPGIPPDDWDRIFLPFQRLGDTDNTTGIGLGLALSRGLTEAMGGSLDPEETPGGGLTMVVSLPATTEVAPAAPGRRERDEATR